MLMASIALVVGLWIFPTFQLWHSDGIRKLGLYRPSVVVVISVCLGCCSLLVCYWISDLKAKEFPAYTGPSFMQMDAVAFRTGYATLRPGSLLSINSYFAQHGPDPLHNVDEEGAIIVVQDPKQTSDFDAQQLFEVSVNRVKRDREEGRRSGSDVGVHDGHWGTFSIPILNQSGVDGLLNGRLRLYFFGWSTWTDLEGRTSEKIFCTSLQKPESVNISALNPTVWHRCLVK